MLRPKTFIFIKLSDTFPSPVTHSAPGFRYPGEYPFIAEQNAHGLSGRYFDTENPLDIAEFNKEAENHFRAPHRHHFPIPVLVTKMVESGFDAPEEVTIVLPPNTPIPEGATSVKPLPPLEPAPALPAAFLPPDQPPPGPPTTAGARKKAQQLGVDLENLRGQGTGAGGTITTDDVVRFWQIEHRKDEGPAVAGPVRMSEILEGAQ